MVRLNELARGTTVKGILLNSLVTIIDVQSHGSEVVELTYLIAKPSLSSPVFWALRKGDLLGQESNALPDF